MEAGVGGRIGRVVGADLLWVVRARGVNTKIWPVGSWSYGRGLSSGRGPLLWVGRARGVNTDNWPAGRWSYGLVGIGRTGHAWWLVGLVGVVSLVGR